MFQDLNEFMTSQSTNVSIIGYSANLFLTGLLCFLLGKLYVHYGSALSNRRRFANNFVLLGMTTMLIISIVKSSLALSLGLVGALSIVRFRSAIKDPEELVYLFITIAIGLGFGANQGPIIIVGCFFFFIVILFQHGSNKKNEGENLFVNISTLDSSGMDIKAVINILKKYCKKVNIRRFSESETGMESSFLIEVNKMDDVIQSKESLKKLSKSLHVTFIDKDVI